MSFGLTLGLELGASNGLLGGVVEIIAPIISAFSVTSLTGTDVVYSLDFEDATSTTNTIYFYVQDVADSPISDAAVVKAGTGAVATATEAGVTGDLTDEPAALSATLAAGDYRILVTVEGDGGLSAVASTTFTVAAAAGLTGTPVTGTGTAVATISGGSGGGTTGATVPTTSGSRHVFVFQGISSGITTAVTLGGNAGTFTEIELGAGSGNKVTVMIFNTPAAGSTADLVMTVNNVFLFPGRIVDGFAVSADATLVASAISTWAALSPSVVTSTVADGEFVIAGSMASDTSGTDMTTLSSTGLTSARAVITMPGSRIVGILHADDLAAETDRTFNMVHDNGAQVASYVVRMGAV